MIKGIITVTLTMLSGLAIYFGRCVAVTIIIGALLGPALEIINVPFLTERFGNLSFGELFTLVLTLSSISYVIFPHNHTYNKGTK
jgi:hypothetical protein